MRLQLSLTYKFRIVHGLALHIHSAVLAFHSKVMFVIPGGMLPDSFAQPRDYGYDPTFSIVYTYLVVGEQNSMESGWSGCRRHRGPAWRDETTARETRGRAGTATEIRYHPDDGYRDR